MNDTQYMQAVNSIWLQKFKMVAKIEQIKQNERKNAV